MHDMGVGVRDADGVCRVRIRATQLLSGHFRVQRGLSFFVPF